MRKVIAAINMTLDGFCDHTAGIAADEELHQHYAELIQQGGVLLYGRKTYELMTFWQTLLSNPSEEESMNDFAKSIDRVDKIVFSQTLQETGWASAYLARKSLEETVSELKQQTGSAIMIGSRSLIIQLLNSGFIDEFQLCIHPVIEGKGMPLFDQIEDRKSLRLTRIKTLKSGAFIAYYSPESTSQ